MFSSGVRLWEVRAMGRGASLGPRNLLGLIQPSLSLHRHLRQPGQRLHAMGRDLRAIKIGLAACRGSTHTEHRSSAELTCRYRPSVVPSSSPND